MTDTEILVIVLREICAYGRAWRYDWSEFDGRTLRAQLDELATWAESRMKDHVLSDFREGSIFLEETSRK